MATFETTTDGFTGHEMLDDFGLIHMNGRVYDPAIGRFLSADPFVQAPENSQSFNRYSYVMNNPLSLVDPSGYSFASPIDYGFDNNADLGVVLGNENVIDANLTLWQVQLDQTLGTDLLGRYDTGQTYTNYELKTLSIAFEAKFNHDKSFRDGWLQEDTQVFQQESLPIAPAPRSSGIDRVALQYQINNQIDHQLMGLHSSETLSSYRTTTWGEAAKAVGFVGFGFEVGAYYVGSRILAETGFSLSGVAVGLNSLDKGEFDKEGAAWWALGRGGAATLKHSLGDDAAKAFEGTLMLRSGKDLLDD